MSLHHGALITCMRSRNGRPLSPLAYACPGEEASSVSTAKYMACRGRVAEYGHGQGYARKKGGSPVVRSLSGPLPDGKTIREDARTSRVSRSGRRRVSPRWAVHKREQSVTCDRVAVAPHGPFPGATEFGSEGQWNTLQHG